MAQLELEGHAPRIFTATTTTAATLTMGVAVRDVAARLAPFASLERRQDLVTEVDPLLTVPARRPYCGI